MHELDRVDSELYNGGQIIKLLQKLTELWHFCPLRGRKGKVEKLDVAPLCNSFERSTPRVYNDSMPNDLTLIS